MPQKVHLYLIFLVLLKSRDEIGESGDVDNDDVFNDDINDSDDVMSDVSYEPPDNDDSDPDFELEEGKHFKQEMETSFDGMIQTVASFSNAPFTISH